MKAGVGVFGLPDVGVPDSGARVVAGGGAGVDAAAGLVSALDAGASGAGAAAPGAGAAAGAAGAADAA
ncbi:hypothetical protein, partial [Kitasatospora sp. NPDC058046]